jgi:integrase
MTTARNAQPASPPRRPPRRILKAVARGEYANTTGKLTFRQFFDLWSPRQIWAPGTVKKVDQAINSVTFADVPLDRLRPSHLRSWIKTMNDKPLAPNTIRSRFDHVRAVIRAAVADRAIPFDVTATVTLPRARRAEAAMVVPTTTEVGDALHHAPDNFAAFVAVCAFGGLRLGEAGGLRVSDINFMRREIRVERQVQLMNGGGVDIRPPTYNSERTSTSLRISSRSSPSMCACTSPAITQTAGCSPTGTAYRCTRTQPGICGTRPAIRPGLTSASMT